MEELVERLISGITISQGDKDDPDYRDWSERIGVLITQNEALKALELIQSTKEINPMASPVHFGRWLLGHAEQVLDSGGYLCYKYNGKEYNTDQIYLVYLNILEEVEE